MYFTKLNSDLNISLNVIAYPRPTFAWIKFSGIVYNISVDQVNGKIFNYMITTEIQITKMDQFGSYNFSIRNSVGRYEGVMSIISAGNCLLLIYYFKADLSSYKPPPYLF